MKVSQCTGFGQAVCKRCYDNGDCKVFWVTSLYHIGGLKGCYCRECVKALVVPWWHKVADGDVPNDNRDVISDSGNIVYYDTYDQCWVDTRSATEIDDIVAWCEVPVYKG